MLFHCINSDQVSVDVEHIPGRMVAHTLINKLSLNTILISIEGRLMNLNIIIERRHFPHFYIAVQTSERTATADSEKDLQNNYVPQPRCWS